MIQLGYRDSNGRISALLLQVFRHQSLPRALLVCVSGGLKRIDKDFNCTQCVESANFISLGSHARKRDVVHNGTEPLEKLVQLTLLGEKLDIAPSVRLSRWSCSELCDAQTICSPRCHEVIGSLRAAATSPNLLVGILRAHGNVASMAT